MSNEHDNAPTMDIAGDESLVSSPNRRQLKTVHKVGIAVVVLLIFVFYIWISHMSRMKTAEKPPAASVDQITANFRAAPIALPPPPEHRPPPQRVSAPVQAERQQSHEMSAAESPIFAFAGADNSAAGLAVTTATPPGGRRLPAGAVPAGAGAAPAAPLTGLAAKLQPTQLPLTRAGLLPHPDMLITQGTMIPCTLQTAINTQLPGFVKCVIPTSIRSTTGDVVLLDRGTIVTGEIQSGLVRGQDRVFVLWNRAETPDHAVITLASPGTDELGRSGMEGAVDNHFWERFGSAIMLSLVQGTAQAASGLATSGSNSGSGSGGGAGVYINSASQNGGNVADTALQASINIPPTLSKNQGDNIAIYVAHDLDFSDVYKLSLVNERR